MGTIKGIIRIISLIHSVLSKIYFFRPIYKLFGFCFTRRFKAAEKQHKYAILVAARNEEAVVPNLIDSIRSQDYPKELIDIFVVADNCTDKTAEVARNHGAVCYERFDNEHRTKGYALQFLINHIKDDYGIDSYEGYFIFDADNLLKKDYVSRMNEAFDSGEEIITSYRNTKNFDDNWISASYGVHWLRTARFEHRARSFLHLATRIQGTGYLFANELIKDGWNYVCLTEDRAFCADAVANGYKISYNDRAEFYDEQPTSFKIAMRQRIRWAKGHLQAVAETGPKLFWHIFVTKGAANRHLKPGEGSKLKRLFNNLRLRYMSFDMLSVVFPFSLVSMFRKWSVFALRIAILAMSSDYILNLMPSFMTDIFEYFNITEHSSNVAIAISLYVVIMIINTFISYVDIMLTAAYVFVMERERIKKIKWYKKIWFCFTMPMFEIIGKIATLIALFSKVEWKPIPHTVSTTIEEVDVAINK